MTRLSAAQRDTFASQGYLSPLDGLAASEATEHCRQLEKLIAPTGDRPNGRLRNKPHLLLYWAACVVRDARIVDTVAELIGPDDANPHVDAERLRVILRDIFVAAGGQHDDWDAYDRTMVEQRRVAVFVSPTRIYSN